jgi:hypothetical protein
MSKQIPPATPELNRLRAPAGLIPIIESGLTDSKLSAERAALMAFFCEWTTEKRSTDPGAIKLAESVDEGLNRIKMALAAAVCAATKNGSTGRADVKE